MSNLLRSIYRFFFPVITYEWCIISGVGCKIWIADRRKCRNGVPVGAGWFTTIIKGDGWAEEDAIEMAKLMTKKHSPNGERP